MIDLPPTSADQPPAFTDAAECQAWLAGTPLTNPVQAQALLLRQVGLLNHYSLPAAERLATLELLESSVAFAQQEGARKFAGRPLPLAPPEQAAYDSCQALWQAMITGYLRCLEGSLVGDAALRSRQGALIVRVLRCMAASQLDAYRAGRQPGADFWRLAHELYATAEQAGATEDLLETRHGGLSPRSAYGTMLLLHAASPHELSQRQLAWASRWAHRWAGKLKICAQPPSADRAVPLCVDLASASPAAYRPGIGKGVRWLDTTDLRTSLRKRMALLDQGQSPAKLQLGDDCLQPACGQMLKQTYLRWCKGGFTRQHERHSSKGICGFISGFEAMHYQLSGHQPFRPPGQVDADQLRREREEIATFGRVASRRQDELGRQRGYQIEDWEVFAEWDAVDESATGLHVIRPMGQVAVRVGAGLLVAVRPPDARSLMLGNVRWAMVDGEERLHLGIQMFAGQPEAVAVRNTGLAAVNEKYRQAFLLPAIPALAQPASALLPAGWFKRDRVIEVYTDRPRQIRLVELLDRGLDYDRVSYE